MDELHRESPIDIRINGGIDLSEELTLNNVEEKNPHTPIMFYSPNAVPDQLEHVDDLGDQTLNTTVSDQFLLTSNLKAPSPLNLKSSNSMVDLLPSRFPTDDDEMAKNDKELCEMMSCSALFTSSVIEHKSSESHVITHTFSSSQRTQKRMSIHNNNLSKIFKFFRERLERTKIAFQTSLTEIELRHKERRMMTPNSQSFPAVLSSSMTSVPDYWKNAIQRGDIGTNHYNNQQNFQVLIDQHASV